MHSPLDVTLNCHDGLDKPTKLYVYATLKSKISENQDLF